MNIEGDSTSIAGYVLEGVVAIAGLVFLWRRGLSKAARTQPVPQVLSPWVGGMADLFALMFLAIVGAVLLQYPVSFVVRHVWGVLPYSILLVVLAYAFQVGLLAGVAAYQVCWKPIFPPASAGMHWRESLRDGVVTFLAGFPLVIIATGLWQGVLGLFGYNVEHQTIVETFLGLTSFSSRSAFVILAVVVVPVAEELIFRGAIFRFLRGRVPRWVAIWGSALLFGAAHLIDQQGWSAFLPLVVLGAIFAVAYERTGRIGTTMVAHAVFNLNTLVALLLGVNA